MAKKAQLARIYILPYPQQLNAITTAFNAQGMAYRVLKSGYIVANFGQAHNALLRAGLPIKYPLQAYGKHWVYLP